MYVAITNFWQIQKENMTPLQQVVASVNVTSTSISMASTVSMELQAQKWQLSLQGLKNVVRITLPGCLVFILQWLRVQLQEKFALISGETAACPHIVEIKNCTFYYIYKFHFSHACNFRYCGTD